MLAVHTPPPAQRLAGVASSPVRDLLALIDRPEVISFAGGLPAPELFDLDGLRAAFDRVLAAGDGRRHLQYAPTEGNPDLRALVAARMTARGLPTGAGDLLVTTGSQQGLTLIAAARLDPGAVVAVEEPTYLAALQCFQLAGCRVVPVPAGGLERVLREHRPKLLYLVPNFANPTGRTLSREQRAEIAELTAAHGVWVVEDDPYGELRYRGEPVPALAAQPGAEHVLHLGSFSKIAAPGLRLGWVRTPAALRPALTVAKQAADLHTSTIDQAAAADWLAHTDLDAHIKNLIDAYAERRNAMMAAMPGAAPAGSTWTDPDGGMFTWLRLPGPADTAALLPAALAVDVAFVPGAPFYAGRADPATMRLSFTTHTPGEITEGMRRLAPVLRTPAA
jgi:DNA-binding transcriptional MocR family regulator